ncbi:MAG: hypothetical protein WKG00_34035 [Polyangiaceae bacterium]
MFGGVVAGSGCSLLFDLGRTQCETAADCSGFPGSSCEDNVCVAAPTSGPGSGGAGSGGSGGSGGEGGVPDARWACLGTFTTPKPPAGEKILQTLRFEYAVGDPGVPPPISKLTLCTSLDFGCTKPVDIPLPDRSGTTTFEVFPKTQGFIEVECDPAEECKKTISHLQEPVVLPMKENLVRMVTPGQYLTLVAIADQTDDPMRAPAVLTVEDCNDDRAAGVIIETEDGDPDTVSFYFNGTLPDLEATETDEQGAAGFLNLPIKIINVIARRKDTGEFIGKATFTPQAGTVSYVPIGPTPP